MPTRILFVDDDSKVLNGLRRMLHPERAEWEMAFAGGGAQALEIMASRPFDVVVSDMRMPQMDGAQLLEEVRGRHPDVIRIILSGHSGQEMILKSIGPTHQYLAKPCDAGALRTTIARALALRKLLTDDRVKAAVGRMEMLPSIPALLAELREEVQRPSASLHSVGAIISRDVGMTGQILHLVNSAFFGLPRRVSDPTAAVTYLGLNTVVSLITTLHVFRQVEESCRAMFDVDRMWRHSLNSGQVAKAIAKAESPDRVVAEDALAAGLLHDAGRLVLMSNFPGCYRRLVDRAKAGERPLVELEALEFGATHAEVGAYLVGLWGLPNSISETLAYHHRPRECVAGGFGPLTAVHAACALDHRLAGPSLSATGVELDDAYLAKLGLQARVGEWTNLAREELRTGGECR